MSTLRVISTGYLISLALGCIGIALFGIVLGELLQPQSTDAGGTTGTVGEILAFAVLFSIRLIFWSKISGTIQDVVRKLITLVMLLSVIANVGLLGLTIFGSMQRNESTGAFIFTVIGAISQIATVIWLVKYRNE
ncbi:MAG: hypothetical protein ACRYGI_17500 [Janthinobacterium lividum]